MLIQKNCFLLLFLLFFTTKLVFMLYNDEQTRKDEEQFQQHLEKARSFTEEELDKLMTSMEVLVAAAKRLKAIPAPAKKEAALLERIKKMVKEAADNIKSMQDVLGESTMRQANAYYFHIKKLAGEGNPEAIKIYENLKPGYQASLRSDIGDN